MARKPPDPSTFFRKGINDPHPHIFASNQDAYYTHMHGGVPDAKPYQQKKREYTIRKGKWLPEEERFTSRIISAFSEGTLKLPDGMEGLTLRVYLAEKLNCDPMRITKKYAGASCLGKRIYHEADSKHSKEDIENTHSELLRLEAKFKERLEQLALEKQPEDPEISDSYNRFAITTPNIDAMLLRNNSTNVMAYGNPIPTSSYSASSSNSYFPDAQCSGRYSDNLVSSSWQGFLPLGPMRIIGNSLGFSNAYSHQEFSTSFPGHSASVFNNSMDSHRREASHISDEHYFHSRFNPTFPWQNATSNRVDLAKGGTYNETQNLAQASSYYYNSLGNSHANLKAKNAKAAGVSDDASDDSDRASSNNVSACTANNSDSSLTEKGYSTTTDAISSKDAMASNNHWTENLSSSSSFSPTEDRSSSETNMKENDVAEVDENSNTDNEIVSNNAAKHSRSSKPFVDASEPPKKSITSPNQTTTRPSSVPTLSFINLMANSMHPQLATDSDNAALFQPSSHISDYSLGNAFRFNDNSNNGGKYFLSASDRYAALHSKSGPLALAPHLPSQTQLFPYTFNGKDWPPLSIKNNWTRSSTSQGAIVGPSRPFNAGMFSEDDIDVTMADQDAATSLLGFFDHVRKESFNDLLQLEQNQIHQETSHFTLLQNLTESRNKSPNDPCFRRSSSSASSASSSSATSTLAAANLLLDSKNSLSDYYQQSHIAAGNMMGLFSSAAAARTEPDQSRDANQGESSRKRSRTDVLSTGEMSVSSAKHTMSAPLTSSE